MIRNIRTMPAKASRGVVLAALVLIVAVACYNWFISPHTNYLQAANRYESMAETIARKNRVINKGIARWKGELSNLQDEFKQARALVFDPEGAKDFFNGIEAAAESSGCVLSLLKFEPPNSKSSGHRKGGILRVRRAGLSVLGDYVGLIALIDKLQDRREKVVIDSISIESTGNPDEPGGRLNCQMNVTVYVMQGEEASTHD